MNGQSLYVSRRMGRSLWQQYRVYFDRLELQSFILLHTLVVPLSDIVDVWVSRPPVVAEMFRGRGFAGGMALKLDLADLCLHVAIQKRSGFTHHIHFTPDDPERFVSVCKNLLA